MNYNRVFPIGHAESSPAESHIITAEEAMAMVVEGTPKTLFHIEAIIKLITQPGAAGIVIHPAHNGHHHTLVLFAVDADGKTIGAIALENGQQCPPTC